MLNELIKRYPSLDKIKSNIKDASDAMISCYEKEGKVLLCGNGGSAADCDHIAGELMKGFLKKRSLSEDTVQKMKKEVPFLDDELLSKLQGGLPALSLPSMTAFTSAFSNDAEPKLVYAQAVLSLAKKEDILIALSTSGNSENICAAAEIAKAIGCTVISLTGTTGGQLKNYSDICISVPEKETFKIQELHLPVYHCICALVEEHFYKE